jgi:hypothetical protein
VGWSQNLVAVWPKDPQYKNFNTGIKHLGQKNKIKSADCEHYLNPKPHSVVVVESGGEVCIVWSRWRLRGSLIFVCMRLGISGTSTRRDLQKVNFCFKTNISVFWAGST